MGFSRQEYWRVLPCPLPGDLPDPGIKPASLTSSELASGVFTTRRRQWHPTPVLLLGKSHGRRSLMGCSPWDHEESDTTEQLHFHFSLSCIGDGNGNRLQCSCLENPRDAGAWRAAVYGVTQSQTRLKRLSSSSRVPLIWIGSSYFLPILPLGFQIILLIYSRTLFRASQVVLVVKNPQANAGNIRQVGSLPESGRSSREGHDNPL